MKPLEEIFFKACIHESKRSGFETSEREFSVRNIVNIFSRLGFPHKQLWYYLEKWSGLGLYDYGVTLDLGWFNPDKLPPQYDVLYQEVCNSQGVTDWEDGEFALYISNESSHALRERRKPRENVELTTPELMFPTELIEELRKRALESVGVPPWVLGQLVTVEYSWKDIVKIGDIVTVEIFPISGKMDDDTHYQIDDFIEAVAKKYNVEPCEVKTYMMDNVEFDKTQVPIGIEDCGCYINGIPEWFVRRYENEYMNDIKKGGE